MAPRHGRSRGPSQGPTPPATPSWLRSAARSPRSGGTATATASIAALSGRTADSVQTTGALRCAVLVVGHGFAGDQTAAAESPRVEQSMSRARRPARERGSRRGGRVARAADVRGRSSGGGAKVRDVGQQVEPCRRVVAHAVAVGVTRGAAETLVQLLRVAAVVDDGNHQRMRAALPRRGRVVPLPLPELAPVVLVQEARRLGDALGDRRVVVRSCPSTSR